MSQRVINTVLKLRDQMSKPLKDSTKNTTKLSRETKKVINDFKRLNRTTKDTAKNLAKTAAGMAGAYIGFRAVKGLLSDSTEAAKAQIEAETKLQAVFKATGKASAKEIEMLKKHASALQGVGVVGDEVTLSFQQQMASFNVGAGTVKNLSEGALDLLAQTKGLNASQGDAVNVANMMGKAMTGQVGALSRVGISFTEAQEKVLKFGTEEEKAATLAKVLQQNVGGVNKALAETDQGKIQQANNAFGDMKEVIGTGVIKVLGNLSTKFMKHLPQMQIMAEKVRDVFPLIADKMAIVKQIGMDIYDKMKPKIDWMKDTGLPLLKDAIGFVVDKATDLYNFINDNWKTIEPIILTIVGAMTAYKVITSALLIKSKALAIAEGIKTAVLATGATTVNAITIAQWAWNAAMSANPIALIVIGITALIAIGILLWKNWDTVKEKAGELWGHIQSVFGGIGDWFAGIWGNVKSGFRSFINFMINGLNIFVSNALKPINFIIDQINKLPKMNIPNVKLEVPNIPMFAKGGIATQPSIFGEAGREMAIPLKRNNPRSQMLLEKTDKIINGGSGKGNRGVGSNPIIVNIENFFGTDEFADIIGDKIYTKVFKEVANMA